VIECYFCGNEGKYSVKEDALKKNGEWRNACEPCFSYQAEHEDPSKAKNALREDLADLEHCQWMSWTKYLVENHDIPEKLEQKWKKNWKPYNELTEEEKDKDRKWADKALQIFSKYPKLKVNPK